MKKKKKSQTSDGSAEQLTQGSQWTKYLPKLLSGRHWWAAVMRVGWDHWGGAHSRTGWHLLCYFLGKGTQNPKTQLICSGWRRGWESPSPTWSLGLWWEHGFGLIRILVGAFLVAQMVKNLPAVQETWVLCMGWEDALEEGMATHSSIPAWRSAWQSTPVFLPG